MGQDLSRAATLDRDLFSDDEVDLDNFVDNFDLEGFTQEEVMNYNEIAEHGQRLQDALKPKKVAASIQKVPSEPPPPPSFIKGHEHWANLVAESIRNSPSQPSITKQINHYIRRHPFIEKSLAMTLKSERRQFERNVYDFARGLGLKKHEANMHVVKAREFCGEEPYLSDTSSFEGEIDDTRSTSDSSSLDELAAAPMDLDSPTRQVDSNDKAPAAPEVSAMHAEYAAYMSAGTKPPSKKRKAKAGGVGSDHKSARKQMKLSNKTAAEQAGDKTDEGKAARRALKRERKRQKRGEVTEDDRIELDHDMANELMKRAQLLRDGGIGPKGDTEYLNESSKSQEPGIKGGKKNEKIRYYRYPSLSQLRKPSKDELSEALFSYRGGDTKSSTRRNSCTGETIPDETPLPYSLEQGLDQPRDFCHPMIQ